MLKDHVRLKPRKKVWMVLFLSFVISTSVFYNIQIKFIRSRNNQRELMLPGDHPIKFSADCRHVISTIPSGLIFMIGGQPFITPQTVYWPAGSPHEIGTFSPQGNNTANSTWVSWSDMGPANHTVAPTTDMDYTATFSTLYKHVISTNPANLSYSVDGVPYTSTQSFWWFSGSTHAIATPSPQENSTSQFTWTSWNDAGVINHTVSPASAVNYMATFNTLYKHVISTNQTGLSYSVDGITYTNAQIFLWAPGVAHTIATTSPQISGSTTYDWASWSDGGAQSHNVAPWSAMNYTARFHPRYQYVVSTSPAGLGFSVDGIQYSNAQTFSWTYGTNHTITAVSPQSSPSAHYTWMNWSDGGKLSHKINATSAATYTANFNAEYRHVISTSPAGFNFSIDGIAYSSTHTFWWNSSTNHTIATTSPQTSGFIQYGWVSWSDAGAINHSVSPTSAMNYTANFNIEYQHVISTTPAGLSFTIDNITYTSPHVFWWISGSSHVIGTVSPQANGSIIYTWSNWSDGGAMNHVIAPASAGNYTVAFAVQPASNGNQWWPTTGIVVIAVAIGLVGLAAGIARARARKKRLGHVTETQS